jgi:hypothetical protein
MTRKIDIMLRISILPWKYITPILYGAQWSVELGVTFSGEPL